MNTYIVKPTSVEIGRFGENLAENFLVNKGYSIKFKNYISKFGEIDIIAEKGMELIFLEVKTRSNSLWGEGKDAMQKSKLRKIVKTAELYLINNKIVDKTIRIDLIEVILINNSHLINHIKNILE